MKRLTLNDIQNVSLEVLKDIHSFCICHHINYSLAYGSLIGAIRHKGFIPWDDDIDIIMLRPEYERFCNTYHSQKCKLVSPQDSFINYARVCDIKHTTYYTLSPWTKDNTVGVWIDIFPIDSVEDDFTLFSARINRLKHLLDLQVDGRSYLRKFRFSFNPHELYSYFSVKRRFSNINIKEIKEQIDSIIKEIPFASTNHCSQLVCRGNQNKEFFTLDMFESFHCVPFCDTEFMVANGWQDILELNYGDYMQLPPIEQQQPHGGFVTFYWR